MHAAAAVLGLLLALAAPRALGAQPALEVFVREGCPHCERAEKFLEELASAHPGLRIEIRDVGRDPDSLARLRALARAAGVQPAVPAFRAGEELVLGFRSPETTGREVEMLLFGGAPDASALEAVDVPLLGRLNAGDLGLPLFTVVLGLLDGFNPCAMWVLLFLLSLLVHLKSRRRMLLVGGTFVAVSGAVYFAFLAAWLNVFLWIGLARAVQVGLGAAAMGMGLLHLREAWKPGQPSILRIPEAAKPGIYTQMRRVLYAEDLGAALAAVAVLAFFVNAVELLCTAGLPALYTRVLTLHEIPGWRYYAYLGLYDAAYVFDDLAVLTIAVATLGRHRLREREGRWLQLVSGALLVVLGALLALRPQWLSGIA